MKIDFPPLPIGVVGLALLISLLSCTVGSLTAETTPTPPPTNTPPPPTATLPPGPEPGWTRFTAADAIADEDERDLQAIVIAPDGGLWLGTDRGIYRFDGATWEHYTALGRGISVDVLSLAVGPAGGIWAGTREGLTRFDGSTWTPYCRRDYCERAYCPELKWLFDLAVAPDLAICCLYERGDKHPYERITFAKFDLAWLTDGADRLAAKHLALDSRVIGRTERVRLVLGKVEKDKRNPLFREDKPWEPRFDNLYANVIRDDDGLYKCWYSPFIIDRPSAETPAEEKKRVSYMQAARKMRAEKGKGPWREMGICYAVSKDGIAWEKPDLGLVELKGSKHNNLVLRGPHGTGIWKDPRDPDPQRRYKMIFKGRRMSVAFSPDGLRWSKPVPCAAMAARGDTHNNAFWAPDLGRYVAITRLWDGQRIVGRSQSEDFVRWTRAVEVLRGDTTRQTYAMPVFRYAGVYLGLLMVLDKRTDLVDCELAWSPDTVRWERVCPGTPLIPRGPKGSHDWGCVYAAACPVVLEDEIRLYYGGSDGQHTNWRDGSFCLARLRPDGFACMEPTAPDAVGVVVTKPILCVGQALTVTADAAGGSLRVAVEGAEGLGLDTCRPITQNVTDTRIRWKGDGDLAAFVGRRIRLRFELRAARLYAFGFEGT